MKLQGQLREEMEQLNIRLSEKLDQLEKKAQESYNPTCWLVSVRELPGEGLFYFDGVIGVSSQYGTHYASIGENGTTTWTSERGLDLTPFFEGQLMNNLELVGKYTAEEVESSWYIGVLTAEEFVEHLMDHGLLNTQGVKRERITNQVGPTKK